ncbi:MAG: hypothetical protein KKI02_03700, partial [Planctomycetes bacterium]|nr:hypothetical protein [Planctomycetota bacterium]
VIAAPAALNAQTAVGTAFTYQGQLKDGGVPANDEYDFIFRLFDDPVGGTQVGGDVEIDEWLVSDGLFTVELDFGTGIFTGDALWLEVSVRLDDAGGEYTDLSPRPPLTATPYALYALDGPGSAGFWAANGGDIYNTNSGFVGIGTTSPISMLEVESTDDVHGIRSTVPWIAVWAHRASTTGTWPAIHGECDSLYANGSAVRGIMTSTSPGGSSAGVRGVNNGTGSAGIGVYGSQAGSGWGVYGTAPSGTGVYGNSASGTGVWGNSTSSTGVYGSSGSGIGVHGASSTWDAVVGVNSGGAGKSGVYGVCGPNVDNYGVFGRNDRTFHQNYGFVGGPSHGAYGVSDDTLNEEWTVGYLGGTYSVYGGRWNGNAGTAGYFAGSVTVTGTLSKGGGSFKIDHPLDPENKYLYHSFIESPDMMNIYNGNVTTDENGYAEVTLPEWFDALNRDFRYQLTVIGQFAQAIVGEEIRDNRFVIRTDKPDVKVSWQVTGIRQDPFANKYRIPVEEDKPEGERGMYLHPEAHGQPLELQIGRIEPLEESQTPSLPLPAPSSDVQ